MEFSVQKVLHFFISFFCCFGFVFVWVLGYFWALVISKLSTKFQGMSLKS